MDFLATHDSPCMDGHAKPDLLQLLVANLPSVSGHQQRFLVWLLTFFSRLNKGTKIRPK
jgi:hypothetical protein